MTFPCRVTYKQNTASNWCICCELTRRIERVSNNDWLKHYAAKSCVSLHNTEYVVLLQCSAEQTSFLVWKRKYNISTNVVFGSKHDLFVQATCGSLDYRLHAILRVSGCLPVVACLEVRPLEAQEALGSIPGDLSSLTFLSFHHVPSNVGFFNSLLHSVEIVKLKAHS